MKFFARTLLLLSLALILPAQGSEGGKTVDTEAGKLVLRTWMKPQGLPNNVVNCIQQDDTGYLWLGTMVGLVRFDGLGFRKIRVPTPQGSAELNVSDLCSLPDGSVAFIPAIGGIYRLQNGVVQEHSASKYFNGLRLKKLFFEKSGTLWASTDQELLHLENGVLERYPLEKSDQQIHKDISWATDSAGRTWVAGPNLLAYSEQGKLIRLQVPGEDSYALIRAQTGAPILLGKKMYRLNRGTPELIGELPWMKPHNAITAAFEDRKGRLWVASSKASVHRLENGRWSRLAELTQAVRSFTEDREGNLWIASAGGGIIRVRDQGFTQVPCFASSISEDDTGALWCAKGMEGIERRQAGLETLFHPATENGVRLNVKLLNSDAGGKLWLGTASGLYSSDLQNPEKALLLRERCVPDLIARSAEGYLWIIGENILGHTRAGVFKEVPVIEGDASQLRCLAEDKPNHFLFGTRTQGLYEGSCEGIRPYARYSHFKFGLIHTIWAESPEQIWLGCSGGLLLLQGDKIRKFSSKDGLPESTVLKILPDQQGYLWLVHSGLLSRVSKKSLLARSQSDGEPLEIQAYGQEEGLEAFSPQVGKHPTALRDRDDRLWICTQKDLILVETEQLNSGSGKVPLVLDSVEADQTVLSAAPYHIAPGTKTVRFIFSALSFSSPERVILKHQLVGADAGWLTTPANRQIAYTGLPPGDYRLRVIACNSDGLWNAERIEIPLTMLPSWWQRPWLRITLLLISLSLLAWLIRLLAQRKLKLRVRELERQQYIEKERARIARDLHDELGGSLTSIHLLVQRLEACQVENLPRITEQLNRRVRRLSLELDRVVWIVSPKNSSLDKLGAFINRFATNLFADTKIECRVQGFAELPARPLSPQCQHQVIAVIKEAANNVIKHSKATEVLLSFKSTEETLFISIRDNGVGFEPSNEKHSERNGLHNMYSRARELTGSLEIRSQPGQGTEIAFSVPLKHSTN